MISVDQPHCFGNAVLAAVSSKDDGQMQFGWGEPDREVVANRRTFLQRSGLSLEQSVLLRVRYHAAAVYDVIRVVGDADVSECMMRLEGEAADCLVTNIPNIVLFLPVADCVATVVHDPINNVLALAHLGRHSTVANLAEKLVGYLKDKYKSEPKDLVVWMSPSIKKDSYLLHTADFVDDSHSWQNFYESTPKGFKVDIQGYNAARFIDCGIQTENIHISTIDTATDDNYWSHYSETTVKAKQAPPRFAVYCCLK